MKTKWVKSVVLIAAAVILFVVGGHFVDFSQLMTNALEWIDQLGATGLVVYATIYIAACVLFFPASILTLGAGTLFGVRVGFAMVSVSSTAGAALAFLIGRYLAREKVARAVEGNPAFLAIDQAVADEGWKIVGLTRLSPIFPFSLLNYAYGLTGVSFRHYLLASWIGMVPGTIMYVYLGALAGDLATLGAETERVRSPGEWALFGLGLAATVAVTILITKTARRALTSKT